MDQGTNEKEQPEAEYGVGDLLWAKIGNNPFWPCMVSYDPFEGRYFKKKKSRVGHVIIYHVQYFGKEVQRSWTSPGSIMPYEGKDAFLENISKALQAAKGSSSRKKINSRFVVSSAHQTAWNLAIQEADEARKFDGQERYENYVFKYNTNGLKVSASNNDSAVKDESKEDSNNTKKSVEVYGSDKRCRACEEGNVDLMCSGRCFQYFHKDCLGMINAPENFKCIDCEKGIISCFICKKNCTEPFVCKKCKRGYHEECIAKFPCADMVKKICPYHVCLTCQKENIKTNGKALVNCVRCPTSFHASLRCTPVGSVSLTPSTIICPEHYLGKHKVSPQINCSVPYCSKCGLGGQLVCCETCPHVYHIMCLNKNEVPKGDFYCDDCTKRRYLYTGMIVWSKTGNFRWWPAEIVEFDTLPLNVRNREKFDGEFPIQYFGTDEYYWTHRGRVVRYQDYHQDFVRHSNPRRLESYFKLSLEEAAGAFEQYNLSKRSHTIDEQRNSYKHIRMNRAVPPAQIATLKGKAVIPCFCKAEDPHPCGPSSDCLNRTMFVECHPDVCQAGEKCENQSFQKRSYAKVKVFRTENRGWGLKALEFIPKGSFVIEYVGQIITHEEYRRRVEDMQEKSVQNYYFLYLDSRRMIDAGPQGNLSRFINHACSANCEMSKWSVNGDSRIGIFALRDINPEEELTFNYQYQYDPDRFHQKCYCKTEGCRGFIGKVEEKHKEKAKEKPKKKLKTK